MMLVRLMQKLIKNKGVPQLEGNKPEQWYAFN